MDQRITLLVALCFFIISLHAATASAQSSFPDIAKSKYRESIEFLKDKEAVAGYPDGTFQPGWQANRAELLTMLFALTVAPEQIGNGSRCFPDVGDEWFARFVCYAKDNDIVAGYPDGYFRPEQKVNMAEAMAIVQKAFGVELRERGENENWYLPNLEFSHNNNIFSRYAYLPERPIRREEIAWLLHRIFQIDSGEVALQDERDVRSAGCGVTPPSNPPTQTTLNDVQRDFITVIPDSYDKDEPLPLIFAFHGRTNSNTQVRGYYRVEQATQGGAIMVYPAGIKSGGSFSWSDPGDSASALRDYALFDKILEEMSSAYCIDTDQIYVVAHSLGAWFTNSLACARGDVIRAVGTLGGGRAQSECTGPVAAMVWHNPNDRLVSFSQGLNARENYREQNRCGSDTLPVEPSFGSCVAYKGCAEDAPLIWCPHTNNYASWDGSYYPHNWPRETGGFMWEFFTEL
ncbi:hypothetical protein COV82_05040 [Candidatus Peregrinibacteria bacterium CG11_big_fil_rev_8_21_14_0_20_46_8]|nr:MAG: hypothetical protein COV82_05040 [Candidatus Peregrinibacteria bacterium CG11_big_fil_rev_8_21_14_0_20_46_8]